MLPNNENELIRVSKVTIVGDQAVGKSCLMQKICDPKVSITPVHQRTIGVDFSVKRIHKRDVPLKLCLWDTAGYDNFRTLIWHYYKVAHQIVLVFDVNNEISFQKIASKYMGEIGTYADKAKKPCLILVGTQCDLIGQRARVPKAIIDDFAQKHGMFYYEISTKNGHGIEALNTKLEDNAAQEQYSTLVKQNTTDATQHRSTQHRRSSASRKLLVTTVIAAGTCIIGYGLFCYKAQLGLLVATQAVPALLVGLAILAAIAAYRTCRTSLTVGSSMFHSQRHERGQQQERDTASALNF